MPCSGEIVADDGAAPAVSHQDDPLQAWPDGIETSDVRGGRRRRLVQRGPAGSAGLVVGADASAHGNRVLKFKSEKPVRRIVVAFEPPD